MSDLVERLGSDARRGVVATYIAGNTLATIGVLLVLVLMVLALAGPLLVPHDPLEQSFLSASQGPSAESWFGTDSFGRDVFSRVLLGTRASLAIGVMAPLLAALFGTWGGMLAGYFGGWTDRLLSRFSDLLMSFPSLLVGVMIAAALGPGFRTAIIAIAIALFPRFVRLARAATQVVRREPFIDASIASGRGPFAIMARHVLPNIAGPLIVALSLWIATAIRREGMGDLVGDPWPAAFAGAAITVAVLAFNMVGDALRDLLDPELET
jgi:peptide/nickel transport system permease protein